MSIIAVQTEKGIHCGCTPQPTTIASLEARLDAVKTFLGQTAMDYQNTAQNTIQGQHAIYPQGSLTVDDRGIGQITTIGDSIQQGWECPRCHSINAPFIPKCECK